ncbi:TPA: conjugal transfer protein TraG N-terminal domain-containing protein [Campylobacter jejuni]|uniref:conjugal transfer protein TraG N-terminal domain-containing protein n=1 Tax=Campylobacter jejuni TaxID=197 RepID=UPI00069B3252|nr:conjugal transfer protein TraG N-terminal domain-containing protein [Campylobacter jejuni]ECO2210941.1 conjugal transfer protein TraG [Campylobacter jejuni]ECO2670040.1 conjugal transfer protein TraG [Campylobacter jejuni]HBD9141193.1 conjugal transfer protein TraG N-terminal domain-containing protein [Campylobacter jejuni]HEC2729856.1 conjugal transfer protein TraG N-terminal domain-containing protein [Campylobacter jejuni]HEC2833660.1 conjugal transfer protein TraG N-terminal domain-conta
MKRFYFLFFSTLFFAPSFLFGATNIANSNLIYTWGYGDVMNEIMQAVKGITTETDYIVKAALAISLLLFSIKKAMDGQTSPVFEFGKMFMLFAVVWYMFLKAPNDNNHRFMIHDEVTSKDYVISQIPIGIGKSFALMTQFEKVILEAMEKHFSTPQSTNFSNAGLGFSLQVMSTLPSVKLSAIDATLQKNIDFYFRNCVSVGILLNQQGRNLFQNSDNLMQDLFTNIGNGSQLTPLFKNNNNVEEQSVVPCSDAGPQIVEMIKKDTDEAMKIHAALLGMANDMANYEQKFLGAAQIYNEQAVSARSYLQQSMIMLASQDAIINTAKSVGLNPASVAANTAYADQQFYASMQAQGHMAQTYLPLAKAYLTAIIIGLSWLVALLSIVFGSYAHIKMFFTLCIWIVLWTPILCIINFINDFNLMNVAQVITGGKAALSLGDNMLIFKEVANRSNFMNYLVMSTPVLAYAIAKASEQGFVTFASGLSQALTGASRAAGSFANQQALSTQTSIAAPRGDEVWAVGAGYNTLQSSFGVGGRSFMGTRDMQHGGELVKDNMTGSSAVINADGSIGNASIKGLNAGMTASNLETRQHALSDAIQNSNLSQRALEVASGKGDSLALSENDRSAITNATQHALANAYSKATGVDVKQAYEDLMSGKIGGGIGFSKEIKGVRINVDAGGSVSTGSVESEAWYQNLSKNQQETFNKTFNESLSNEIGKNRDASASFNNLLKTGNVTNSASIKSSMDSYNEAKTLNNSVGYDGGSSIVQGYINENYGGVVSKENVASAVNAVENMAARGDMQGLSHYAGVDSNVNSNGLFGQSKHNYHDPRGVMTDHNKAIDDLNSRQKGFMATRNAPNDVKSEGLAGGIQKAANAAEYKAGTAIKERNEKINDTYK